MKDERPQYLLYYTIGLFITLKSWALKGESMQEAFLSLFISAGL